MVPKTNLTIHDYFKQAGLTLTQPTRVSEGVGLGAEATSFEKVLAGLESRSSTPAAPGAGMRIGDYLKNPVAARLPREPVAEAAGAAGLQAFPEATEPEMCAAAEGVEGHIAMRAVQLNGGETPEMSESARIAQSIDRAAAKYDLSSGLIRSVIAAESNFRVRAVSAAGAQGLMQLMPATARELGVDDAFDVEQNIDGGARYLRRMLDMFGQDLRKALSAYNAGPARVMRYGADVPFRETRAYVQKVLSFVKNHHARSSRADTTETI
jgi:soluble lytic murein transglycosylase-like protein